MLEQLTLKAEELDLRASDLTLLLEQLTLKAAKLDLRALDLGFLGGDLGLGLYYSLIRQLLSIFAA